MDNPNLVRKLRDNFLVKPIPESKGRRIRYNLSNMSIIDQSMGQAAEIRKIIDYTVMNHNNININIDPYLYFILITKIMKFQNNISSFARKNSYILKYNISLVIIYLYAQFKLIYQFIICIIHEIEAHIHEC